MKSRLSLGVGIVCALLLAAGPAVAGTFTPLGFLTGGTNSEAVAVSADGSVIVGSAAASTGLQQGFRWTAGGGMAPLPIPTGQTMSWATDVSADGSYVAGYAGSSFSLPIDWEGFRWHISGAMDQIAVAGPVGVWAKGISGDGSVVVGSAANEAFRWSGGTLVGLGALNAGNFRSNADGISADGQVVVGDTLDVDLGVRDAFRHVDGNMYGLGAFTASAASDDGAVIVGTFDNTQTHLFEAYRWTEATGIVPLGAYYPTGYHSRALGVSGNGTTVVGYIQSDSNDLQSAFIWDAGNGMRLLADVLTDDYAVDLLGWHLTKGAAISADARAIVGVGTNLDGDAEAWRVFIATPSFPEPATLSVLVVGGAMVLLRRRRR